MSRISPRQLLLYLACIAPLGKMVALPTVLASHAKNDLLFPMLAQYLLQAGLVFCVLLLARQKRDLYGLLSDMVGGIAAKVLMTAFAVFLFYAAVMPVLEQKLFVQDVFYDTLPSLIAFAPFFLFAAYLLSKPLAVFGRTWDILAPISCVGFAGLLLLSVGSADYAALLPIGAGGAKGFFGGTMSAFGWFYDAAILLALLGKIDYERGLPWKGALCYLAGGAVILFFLATVYGIFQETTVTQVLAFEEMSKYFAGISMLGRIDYLFIFLLAMVMAFYCILPAQAGIECLLQAYGRPRYLGRILAVSVAAVYLVISVVTDLKFTVTLETVTGTLFWIFPVFTVLVPLLSLFLHGRQRHAAP